MGDALGSIVTVAVAIVGIALLAVLVSRQSQTPQVIQAATSGFAADISAAVSPITGAGFTGISPLPATGIY